MGAVLTWIGTVLGAAGVWLAVALAPSTWASHHHAIYILLIAVIIACLVIAVAAPLPGAIGWGRFRWMRWRAAREFQHNPPPGSAEIVAVPYSPTSARGFQFTTNDTLRRLIRTPVTPTGLTITRPVKAVIGTVPFPVERYGKTIFVVSEFRAEGFVISGQSPGLLIAGEVSYSGDAPSSEPSGRPSSDSGD